MRTITMSQRNPQYFMQFVTLTVVLLVISNVSTALEPFSDNFNRPDNNDVGNGWIEDDNHGITTAIVNNEVLIKGTEDQDWQWVGIRRFVKDIESVFFDYLAIDGLQIHLRVKDTASNAYIALYTRAQIGSEFYLASSKAGEWPGWTPIGGANLGDYNTLGITRTKLGKFQIMLNDRKLGQEISNDKILFIDEVYISVDAAAGVSGTAYVDNVVIDGGSQKAVQPTSKITKTWGDIKAKHW